MSNRVESSPTVAPRLFVRASVAVNVALGNLIRNPLFEEADPEFQQLAFFKTRISEFVWHIMSTERRKSWYTHRLEKRVSGGCERPSRQSRHHSHFSVASSRLRLASGRRQSNSGLAKLQERICLLGRAEGQSEQGSAVRDPKIYGARTSAFAAAFLREQPVSSGHRVRHGDLLAFEFARSGKCVSPRL